MKHHLLHLVLAEFPPALDKLRTKALGQMTALRSLHLHRCPEFPRNPGAMLEE